MNIYSYKNQPENVEAWRFGEACSKASKQPAGDYIDSGLALLQELEAKGYGIVQLADRPVGAVVEWTCFHCGETFTDRKEAKQHFGFDMSADPACRIKLGAEGSLVSALREAERDAAKAWGKLAEESSDAVVAYQAAVSRHSHQLRAAEELGYERGLRDAHPAADRVAVPRELVEACLHMCGRSTTGEELRALLAREGA